eukprot:gnl/MRDRNA2_/MRDRNA2_130919_c0_seq1.p1 gnl/MRDRNA2_/MRDRNA2_130919_c0~~gnl/MRDRNA2_/MRDRNA2_130919_c0_seq1.p1  ORF type:complete len:545 (-),score=89.01 gnl/MRDRNA2_/MRDRNA2_130919_c0_seq1:115-1626(-)
MLAVERWAGHLVFLAFLHFSAWRFQIVQFSCADWSTKQQVMAKGLKDAYAQLKIKQNSLMSGRLMYRLHVVLLSWRCSTVLRLSAGHFEKVSQQSKALLGDALFKSLNRISTWSSGTLFAATFGAWQGLVLKKKTAESSQLAKEHAAGILCGYLDKSSTSSSWICLATTLSAWKRLVTIDKQCKERLKCIIFGYLGRLSTLSAETLLAAIASAWRRMVTNKTNQGVEQPLLNITDWVDTFVLREKNLRCGDRLVQSKEAAHSSLVLQQSFNGWSNASKESVATNRLHAAYRLLNEQKLQIERFEAADTEALEFHCRHLQFLQLLLRRKETLFMILWRQIVFAGWSRVSILVCIQSLRYDAVVERQQQNKFLGLVCLLHAERRVYGDRVIGRLAFSAWQLEFMRRQNVANNSEMYDRNDNGVTRNNDQARPDARLTPLPEHVIDTNVPGVNALHIANSVTPNSLACTYKGHAARVVISVSWIAWRQMSLAQKAFRLERDEWPIL